MSESKADIVQGTFDLMVLRTFDTMGPMHNWGVAQRIQQISEDTLYLNQGTLCPALLRLMQKGWIFSKWGTSDNNRSARFYSLTKRGRKQLEIETENWERMTSIMARLLEAK